MSDWSLTLAMVAVICLGMASLQGEAQAPSRNEAQQNQARHAGR
jgi:hypothetical protein